MTEITDKDRADMHASIGAFERRVIAHAATLKHEYPSRYKPGTHWSTDAAWELLDKFAPGAIENDHRFLLAGMIAGALMRVRTEGEAHGRLEAELAEAKRRLAEREERAAAASKKRRAAIGRAKAEAKR